MNGCPICGQFIPKHKSVHPGSGKCMEKLVQKIMMVEFIPISNSMVMVRKKKEILEENNNGAN